MQELLAGYILDYGYLAIFCVILLQETGVPGLPNEIVLFYFGYVGHQFHLHYSLTIVIVIIADVTGSFLLYILFFQGRSWLFRIKPSWLRSPSRRIEILKRNIVKTKGRNLFVAKLTPFVRGYVPVAAGILQVHPLLYGRVILLAATVWSGGWLTIGWLFYALV